MRAPQVRELHSPTEESKNSNLNEFHNALNIRYGESFAVLVFVTLIRLNKDPQGGFSRSCCMSRVGWRRHSETDDESIDISKTVFAIARKWEGNKRLPLIGFRCCVGSCHFCRTNGFRFVMLPTKWFLNYINPVNAYPDLEQLYLAIPGPECPDLDPFRGPNPSSGEKGTVKPLDELQLVIDHLLGQTHPPQLRYQMGPCP